MDRDSRAVSCMNCGKGKNRQLLVTFKDKYKSHRKRTLTIFHRNNPEISKLGNRAENMNKMNPNGVI